MNPARSLGPAIVSGQLQLVWIYLTAPLIGAGLGVVAYELPLGRVDEGVDWRTETERAPWAIYVLRSI